jgi:catechol 2,3-dioxygenase-like lactoylglutathione lyase family enzyme
MTKIIGIDHMTFGVKDLEQRITTFKRVFGAAPLFQRVQESRTAISFELGGNIINLISEPENGGGEGLDHIGLAVDDLKGLKDILQTNGVEISPSRLESEKSKRDDLYIGKSVFPSSLQIVNWENNKPPSIDDWVSSMKNNSDRDKFVDLRSDSINDDSAATTRAKIIDLDHVCFAVKDLAKTVEFIENILGCRVLASGSRGGETSQTFMDVGGYIFNFVTAPMGGTSFFADFLKKKGEALHHIGFSVDNLDAFKEGMAAHGIQIPKWELEGDPEIRDEVLIGTKHIPTVFQIIQWTNAPPSSVEEWMALEEQYTAGN